MPYSLSVTEGSSYNLSASGTSSSLSLSLTGPAGPSGPEGPAGDFDGMPAALTFAGADPNASRLSLAGTFYDADSTAVVFPELVFDASVTDAWVDAPSIGSIPNYAVYRNDAIWYVLAPSGLIFSSTDPEDNPAYVTGWADIGDATGSGTLVITAEPLEGTELGQLCLASSGWWKWNGDVWEEEASAADLAGKVPYTGATEPLNMGDHPIHTQTIYLEGLLSIADDTAINIGEVTSGNFWTALGGLGTITEPTFTTPLPITSGGTGGDTAGAARTALKVPGSIAGVGGSIAISNIVSITLANYTALTKDPATLYVING